jgi:hypothetical protein
MQTLKISAVAAAFALLASGAFAAPSVATSAYRGEAKLATPVSAPSETVISGVTWKCDGDTCVGAAERHTTLDNPVRECKKVAAQMGPLAGYVTRGREVTGGNLKACNTAAAAKAGDSAVAQK